MKKFILILAFLMAGCSGVSTADLDALQQVLNTQYPSSTPAASATATITPSPTIDYQSTLVIQQATTDETRRLNTQATAEFEQRAHEEQAWAQQQVGWTAQADAWTATAALTSIPLTSTQQTILNTQIPAQQILASSNLTATHEAPTQMVAMSRAENQVLYGPVYMVGSLVAMLGIGMFTFGFGVFMLRKSTPKPAFVDSMPQFIQPIPDPQPRVYSAPPETVVTLRTDHGAGFGTTERMVIPCRPDQFTELCEGVINGVRSLAINVWEGAQQPFTRGEFMRVRNWLQQNRLAQSTGAGSMILTAEGETLFRAYMESHALPGTFKFEEVGE